MPFNLIQTIIHYIVSRNNRTVSVDYNLGGHTQLDAHIDKDLFVRNHIHTKLKMTWSDSDIHGTYNKYIFKLPTAPKHPCEI